MRANDYTVIKMKRHHLLLQEMGITQWELIRPECLKGMINTIISEHIRLVIVSETEELCSSLLQDVLHSLETAQTEYLSISFDSIQYLQLNHKVYYWLLNDDQEKINLTLPYCHNALSQWQSPSWNELKKNPQAKRELWRQIQQTRK